MRIEINIPRGGGATAHAALATRLRRAGHATRLAATAPLAQAPVSIAALFALEDAIYGPVKDDLFAAAGMDMPGFEGDPDLIIDFQGDAKPAAAPILSPRFNGARGEIAAIAALLSGRAPETSIVIERVDAPPRELARGLPAIPFPFRVKESRNRIRAREIDLIAKAVARFEAGDAGENPISAMSSARSIAVAPLFGLAGVAAKIAARLRALATGARDSHWRVAWRPTRGDAVRDSLKWPTASYAVLPDDGARYYADPFFFVHEGRTWLFVEEFPYATNKGILSVCEFGPNGPLGTPRPILEIGCHLSYPFVFERDGAIYMMPESVGENRLALYRAVSFPDVWAFDRVLMDNIGAADATLLEREGRLWLFASVAADGQSDWDTLSIFHAASLEREWTPLTENPVLFDAGSARCGGRFFEREGQLYRPAQDCSRGYGSALAICRVDRLDAGGFVQSVAARLSAPTGMIGAHTLNDANGFEVIDTLGRPGSRVPTQVDFVNQDSRG